MSAPINVLAVMDRAFGAAHEHYDDLKSAADEPALGPAYQRACRYMKEHREARAAVADLIEVADAALGVLGAYAEKIEGEWGVCLTLDQMLANGEEPEYAALRDSLARVRGAA